MRRFYGESDERISVVVSVVLEAFERDEYWAVLQKIEESRHQDIQTFADALETFGILEIALMAQQAQRRMRFIDQLDALVANPKTLEKSIHAVLEKNLWVFGIEYSLMSSNVTLNRVISDYTGMKFKGQDGSKRPDLFLARNLYGKHLLIEFKRPSHSLTRDDENQAVKYRDDLTRQFNAIEIIVLGKSIHESISAHYPNTDVKLMSYSMLLGNARSQMEWLMKELMRQ
jgi:hypothetical protein